MTSIPDDKIAAHIFDVDGTLIDSMPPHYTSWCEALASVAGIGFPEHRFYELGGTPLPEVVRITYREEKALRQQSTDKKDAFDFAPEEVSEEVIAAVLKEKERVLHENHMDPAPIDCVISILRKAKEEGVPRACATSGQAADVRRHLKAAGLWDLFDDESHIVCVGELPPGRGKPLPDVFLEAARRLNVKPELCRGYEDGPVGMVAVKAAGMELVDVRVLPGYPVTPGLQLAMEHEKKI